MLVWLDEQVRGVWHHRCRLLQAIARDYFGSTVILDQPVCMEVKSIYTLFCRRLDHQYVEGSAMTHSCICLYIIKTSKAQTCVRSSKAETITQTHVHLSVLLF